MDGRDSNRQGEAFRRDPRDTTSAPKRPYRIGRNRGGLFEASVHDSLARASGHSVLETWLGLTHAWKDAGLTRSHRSI
jgi:hypothetical protein